MLRRDFEKAVENDSVLEMVVGHAGFLTKLNEKPKDWKVLGVQTQWL